MFSPLELLLQQIHLTLWQHHKGGKWRFKTRQEQQQTLLWGVERNHLHFALTQRLWQDRTQGPLGFSKRECTANPMNSLQAAPVHARQWEGQQTCSQRHSAISSPSIFLLQKKIWCNTLGIIRLQKSAHLQIYCSRDWNLFPSIFSVPLPPFSSLCWR